MRKITTQPSSTTASATANTIRVMSEAFMVSQSNGYDGPLPDQCWEWRKLSFRAIPLRWKHEHLGDTEENE
jgi:hypothetical protein